MDRNLNIVEIEVLLWIKSRNLPYEKTDYGFKIPQFNIKCVSNEQSTPIYKTSEDRIVSQWAMKDHILKLSAWLDGRPTIRIEKLKIDIIKTDSKIIIQGTKDTVCICEAEYWIESDCLYWYDTRYYGYHVPGWLSKCLRLIERQNLRLPIETITNAIQSSYHRIGFKTVEQVDVRYYNKRSKHVYMPYRYPENIIMWRLIYDNKCTV